MLLLNFPGFIKKTNNPIDYSEYFPFFQSTGLALLVASAAHSFLAPLQDDVSCHGTTVTVVFQNFQASQKHPDLRRQTTRSQDTKDAKIIRTNKVKCALAICFIQDVFRCFSLQFSDCASTVLYYSLHYLLYCARSAFRLFSGPLQIGYSCTHCSLHSV